jgi:hypothetical protein
MSRLSGGGGSDDTSSSDAADELERRDPGSGDGGGGGGIDAGDVTDIVNDDINDGSDDDSSSGGGGGSSGGRDRSTDRGITSGGGDTTTEPTDSGGSSDDTDTTSGQDRSTDRGITSGGGDTTTEPTDSGGSSDDTDTTSGQDRSTDRGITSGDGDTTTEPTDEPSSPDSGTDNQTDGDSSRQRTDDVQERATEVVAEDTRGDGIPGTNRTGAREPDLTPREKRARDQLVANNDALDRGDVTGVAVGTAAELGVVTRNRPNLDPDDTVAIPTEFSDDFRQRRARDRFTEETELSESDIAGVQQTEDGFTPEFTESYLNEEAERISRELGPAVQPDDVSFQRTDDGAYQPVLDDDSRQRLAREQFEADVFGGRRPSDGGLTPGDDAQQVTTDALQRFDREDFRVEQTDDGLQIVLEEDATQPQPQQSDDPLTLQAGADGEVSDAQLQDAEQAIEQESATIPGGVPGVAGTNVSGQARDVDVVQTEDGEIRVVEQERFGDFNTTAPSAAEFRRVGSAFGPPGALIGTALGQQFGGRETDAITGEMGDRIVTGSRRVAGAGGSFLQENPAFIAPLSPAYPLEAVEEATGRDVTPSVAGVGVEDVAGSDPTIAGLQGVPVGAAGIADQGLNLPQETAEFAVEGTERTVEGEGGEFARDVGDAAVGRGIVTGRSAAANPAGFTGQLVGGALLSGGAIAGASRFAGPRAATAVDYAIQPGEAAARTAASRGAVSTRTATLIPGVREGQIRGQRTSVEGETEVETTDPDLPPERAETLTAEQVDDAMGVTGPSRTSRARGRLDRLRERASERVSRTSVESRAGAGLVPPRVETDSESSSVPESEQFTDFDPSRSEVLEGSPRDRMSRDISDRSQTQREQMGGGFELETDPLATTGGRQGPILTESGEIQGLDPVRRRGRRTGREVTRESDTLLSTTSATGAVGGVAAAATAGPRSRLDAAQTPSVTEREVLSGRPETILPVASATGTGALGLLGDAEASVSDFQGNIFAADERTQTASEATVQQTGVLDVERAAQDVSAEERADTVQEVRQDTRQETGQEVREEVRPETRQDLRPELRTETRLETRLDNRFERRRELWFETTYETRNELTQEFDSGLSAQAGGTGVAPRGEPFSSSPAMDEPELFQGWLSETVFTIGTGGTAIPDRPSQDVLEAQPGSAFRTGEFPTEQELEDPEVAAAIADVEGLFGQPTGDGEPLFDFGLDFEDNGGLL